MDKPKRFRSPRSKYTKDKSEKKSAKLRGFSQQTASNCMRLYKKAESNPQLIANLTPTQAYKARRNAEGGKTTGNKPRWGHIIIVTVRIKNEPYNQ